MSKIKSIATKMFPKEKVSVNKILYIVLALLCGGYGAHKFYAKKFGMGIVYILLGLVGISGTVAFIEAVIALFKKCDTNNCIEV